MAPLLVSFTTTLAKRTDPASSSASHFGADDLLQRLDEVHARAIRGLEGIDPSVLLEPVEMPYAAYPIKLGAILFCPMHEQIHAGQIGLIRRLLGLPSVR